jgi:hypothetical protein
MWQYLRNQVFSAMYHLGKEPPTSSQLKAAFDELKADGGLCDCQVIAGGRTIHCEAGISKPACDLIGDTFPGTTGVPLPLGSCKNLPGGGS